MQYELLPLQQGDGITSQNVTNHTNLMIWGVVVQQLMATDVKIEVVEKEIVTEAVVPKVVLIEVVVVQFEFAVLSGNVPRWGSSGHSPLPAM